MDLQINDYEFGEKPSVTRPDTEFYTVMGEAGIRAMVSKHYDLLRASSLKNLFPKEDNAFEQSKHNSADFMIQILGGPEFYNQNRGQPVLVKRHRPFSITPEGRVTWLTCYRQVLMEIDAPEHLIVSFWNYLNVFSNWMVNTKSDPKPFKM